MTVEELKELLYTRDEVLVKFIKKDGTERIMRCTLSSNVIPPIFGTSVKGPEHLITVYDLDKDAWRSINLTGGFSVRQEV